MPATFEEHLLKDVQAGAQIVCSGVSGNQEGGVSDVCQIDGSQTWSTPTSADWVKGGPIQQLYDIFSGIWYYPHFICEECKTKRG